MTTYSMLASPGQQFYPRSGNPYTANAFGRIPGVTLGDLEDLRRAGCIDLGQEPLNDAAAWNANAAAPVVLAAAGTTALAATKITSNRIEATVTTSSEGVVLKAVATGAETWIGIKGTKGVKYYAPPNSTMDALSTGTGTQLAAGKGVLIEQTGATSFVTKIKGA